MGDFEKTAKAVLRESFKATGERGQAQCRVLGSAVAVTERTVYRWRNWLAGTGTGDPPSAKKLVALARWLGWPEERVRELKSSLLEGA